MASTAPHPLDEYLILRDEVSERASRLFTTYDEHLRCRRGCYYCCDEITVLPIELEALRRWIGEHGMPTADRLGGPPSDRGETPEAIREREEARRRGSASASGRAGAPERASIDRSARASIDRSAHGTFPPPPGAGRRCAFLGRAGECTVYGGRPVICRTHGLPLAYRVYEYDIHGREVAPDHPRYTDLWCDLNFTTLGEQDAPRLFDREGRVDMDGINRTIESLNEAFLATEAGSRYRGLPPGEDRFVLGVLLR